MLRYALAALAAFTLVLGAGCSSSGGSGGGATLSATPTASSAVCSSVASLKSSVAQLKNLDITSTSIDQLKSKLTAVGTDIRQLANSAKGQYAKYVDAVQHDYASLKSAIKIAVQNPTYPTIAQVRTRFMTLANSVQSLAQTAASRC